jgi:transcriptional regulator with XRE-family HTH domain
VSDAAPRPALIALAGGLRDARTQRGVGLRRLADMVDLHPSVLSAFELGKRVPLDTTVAHILGVLRSPNTVRDQLVDLAHRANDPDLVTHDKRGEDFLRSAYERRAEHVFEWSPMLVPEALQTVDYARALQASSPVDIDAAHTRSLVRTVEELASPDASKTRYTFLIGEAATLTAACSTGRLRTQMDAAIALTGHRRVSVRLVLTADCPPGLLEPFTLYEDNVGAFAIAVRHHQGAVFITHEAALTTYKKTARSLERRATEISWT